MGFIGRVVQFTRIVKNGVLVSFTTVNPGNGQPNITAEHVAPPGDDSHPLPSDYVKVSADSGTGRKTVVGYYDPQNEAVAAVGEKRLYSRNADGEIQAEVWLNNDGTISGTNSEGGFTYSPSGTFEVTNSSGTFSLNSSGQIDGQNSSGFFTLQSGGAMKINNATITTDGDVVTSDGISLRNHLHIGNLGALTSKPV